MARKSVTYFLGVNITQLKTGLARAQMALAKTGAKMKTIGRSMTMSLTLPFAMIGAAGAKMAIDFQDSMTKINTLVGITAEEVNSMAEEVKKLSGETAKSPQELADALFTVTSAGLRGNEAMEALEQAAKASAIGMGNTGDIAKALTGIMQSYGDENMTAARATEILMATIREGNLDAEALAPVLGRVTGIASQLGISFEEVGASIATFTRLGVSAEEAVTGLRGIMNSILKPTAQSEAALAEVGVTFDELTNKVKTDGLADTLIELVGLFGDNTQGLAQVIPNVRALSTVLGTAGAQGEAYAQIAENINNSNGILNEGFETVQQTAGFKLKQTFEELKKIGMDLGAMMLPFIQKIATFMRNIVNAWNDLSPEMKNTAMTVAMVVAAIGPLTAIAGALVTAFSMMLSPIGLTVLALAGIGVVIAKNWDAVRNFIVNSMQGFVDLYNESMSFKRLIEGLKFVFKGMWEVFKLSTKLMLNALMTVGNAIKAVFGKGTVKDAIADGLAEGVRLYEEMAVAIMDDYATMQDNIANRTIDFDAMEWMTVTEAGVTKFGNDLWNKIQGFFETGGPSLNVPITGVPHTGPPMLMPDTSFSDRPEGMYGPLTEAGQFYVTTLGNASTATDDLIEKTDQLAQAINQSLTSAINAATDAFSNMIFNITTKGEKIKIGQSFLNALVGIMDMFGKQLIAIAFAEKAFLESLKDPSRWYIALIAGIGLVAGAAALKGFLSNKATAFAEGGIVRGPTLGLVGEAGPEAIIPLSKIDSLIGGGNVNISGRIAGPDIVLTNRINSRNLSRVTGGSLAIT